MSYLTEQNNTLHDVVDDTMEIGGATEYCGLHIINAGQEFIVQCEGHVGQVDSFSADEYDDVLDLVNHLNSLEMHWRELVEYGEDGELVDWAGRMVTRSERMAEEQPEKYVQVPDEIPGGE